MTPGYQVYMLTSDKESMMAQTSEENAVQSMTYIARYENLADVRDFVGQAAETCGGTESLNENKKTERERITYVLHSIFWQWIKGERDICPWVPYYVAGYALRVLQRRSKFEMPSWRLKGGE